MISLNLVKFVVVDTGIDELLFNKTDGTRWPIDFKIKLRS